MCSVLFGNPSLAVPLVKGNQECWLLSQSLTGVSALSLIDGCYSLKIQHIGELADVGEGLVEVGVIADVDA